MQIAEGQLKQQQGQHGPDRLEHQPLPLQHLAQGGCQADLAHQWSHHGGAGGQHDGAEHRCQRPVQSRQPVGREQAGRKGEHQPHQHDAQHGLAGAVIGQAQVDAAIEQHQAHQQAHHRAQPCPEVEGFDQAKARAPDHQAGTEQQHHPRQTGEPGKPLGHRTGKHGDAPEQPQPLRCHSSRALNLGST